MFALIDLSAHRKIKTDDAMKLLENV